MPSCATPPRWSVDWGSVCARRRRRSNRRFGARMTSCGRTRPLVARALAQTRARVLGGDTHVADTVLSIFEPHTETIRKGKMSKPNEFGKLVAIQEAEHQIITRYDVHARRRADVTLWTAALDRHHDLWPRAGSGRRRSGFQLRDQ